MSKRSTIGILLLGALNATLLLAVAEIGFKDWQQITTPGSNPAANYLRMYADTSSGMFKCLTSAGASCYFSSNALVNPMTTSGDIIYGGASGAVTRLPAGMSGYVLQTNGGGSAPTWVAAASGTVSSIASGTQALGTSAIAAGACATAFNISASGVASSDRIQVDFNANPTSITGYGTATTGNLTIYKWPTTNTVNIQVCNNNATGTITPSAATLNYGVLR